ncbi:hypothetical protein ACFX11_000406 [Malus domestica]
MENEDEVALSSNPNPNLLATDQSLEKKHQSMLNRLSNRHQTRLDSSLTRRSADSSSSPSFESTSTFLSRFSNSKSSIINKPTRKDPITEPKEEEKVQEPEKKSGFRVPNSPGEANGLRESTFCSQIKELQGLYWPVIGSVSVDGVERCVFVMASHQIRIHNAKTSDFYLRVKSRPIIKDSCGVRFAPYYLTYKGIEKELREASLDEETEKWSNVDDFLWLRAIQSPNWFVLPENERLGLIDISKSEES